MLTFAEYLEEMKKDPCWKGYEMIGTKKKNGKEVPNCVPEETELDESGGQVVFKQGDNHIEKYSDHSFAVYRGGQKGTYYPTLDDAKAALNEATYKVGQQVKLHPTIKGGKEESGKLVGKSGENVDIEYSDYLGRKKVKTVHHSFIKETLDEATYKGKEVKLNKPMAGDVKKSKVYVDPDGDGKAKKVEFGDPNMTIKKNIPARRKSFRARHNCDNPGPKDKARYWSCRAW